MRYNVRLVLLRFAAVLVLVSSSGVALDAHAAGRWCITNDVLLFGNHALATSTSSSATVTNCGDQPWSFTDVSIHSATGPAFHVTTTCTTGMTLGPGQSCSASVVFAPQVAGQTSGALWLRNTTNTPTQLLTFYGRGVEAQAGNSTLLFLPTAAV